MFEKIQAIGKIIILPAIILYVGGFICITGFLARFGFVTFDVVNARFLIAGFHALLPLSLSLLFVWWVYKQLNDKTLYTYAAFQRRLLIYSEMVAFPIFAAFALNALYTAADFTKMSDPDAFHLGPFGSWDIVGLLLSNTHGFGLRLAVYISAYCLITIVPIYVIAKLYLQRRRSIPAQHPPDASTVLPEHEKASEQPASPNVFRRMAEFFRNAGIAAKAIALSADIIAICILIAAGIDSYWRVRSEVLDADAIAHLKITTDLLQAWFYLTNFTILFFLFVLPFRPAQLSFSNFDQWLNPSNVPNASRYAAPILGALFLFGATVFPRMPVAIGGGMPREVSVSLKVQNPSLAQGKTYLLFESSQFVFVVQVDTRERRAYQINKDVVAAVETWQATLAAPKTHRPPLPNTRPRGGTAAQHGLGP